MGDEDGKTLRPESALWPRLNSFEHVGRLSRRRLSTRASHTRDCSLLIRNPPGCACEVFHD